MSYTITVNGHLDESEKELEIMEEARAFVSELEGATTATFSGMHHGTHDLMPQEPAASE